MWITGDLMAPHTSRYAGFMTLSWNESPFNCRFRRINLIANTDQFGVWFGAECPCIPYAFTVFSSFSFHLFCCPISRTSSQIVYLTAHISQTGKNANVWPLIMYRHTYVRRSDSTLARSLLSGTLGLVFWCFWAHSRWRDDRIDFSYSLWR